MKRVLVASAPVGLLAMTLSGCYWLASYADLTSGLTEAGAPSADSGVSPPVVEAGAGAADVTTVAHFCPTEDAGQYVYCMDFDDVDADSLGLGGDEADAEVVTGTYVSPPSSLAVSLYGTPSGGGYGVEFPFQPSTGRLEFEMQIVGLDAWVTTMSMSLYQASEQTHRNLNVVLSPSGEFQIQEYIELGDGGIEQNGHTPYVLVGDDGGPADAGGWHHVVLQMTVDDSNQLYTSSLAVDGQVMEDGQPLALPWAQGTVSIGVGVSYAGSGGSEFFFDNVRADFGF